MNQPHRPYQLQAFAALKECVARGTTRAILNSPTGSGKTHMGGMMVEGAIIKGRRVLWLAHREELIGQASRKIGDDLGIHHGVIMAKHWRDFPALPVQVGSVQTVARRLDRLDLAAYDLCIVDEAHHSMAKSYRDIFAALRPDIPIIGLTATPYREDGNGLGMIYGEIVKVTTIRELIAGGYLVPWYPVGPKIKVNTAGVRMSRGDHDLNDLGVAMMKGTLIGDLVQTWKKFAEGRRSILFAVNIEHSLRIMEVFRAAGVACEHVDGKTPQHERADKFARFERGEITILNNVGVATEGTDMPHVECVIGARPTLSRGLWRQMVGRGGRPYLGKSHCLVIDHANWYITHGDPHEDDDVTLEYGIKRPSIAKPAKCPHCGMAFAVKPDSCPRCNTDLRSKKKQEGAPLFVDAEMVLTLPGGLALPSLAEKQEWLRVEAAKAKHGGRDWREVRAAFKKRFGYDSPTVLDLALCQWYGVWKYNPFEGKGQWKWVERKVQHIPVEQTTF